MNDTIEVVLGILAALGGGGAIILAFSSWLGKVWADRLMAEEAAKHATALEGLRNQLRKDNESHHFRLRKSEIIFEKQLQAASDIVLLVRELHPLYYIPDMDADDFYDYLANKLEKLESAIHIFLKTHGAVIPEAIKKQLVNASGICGDNKFDGDQLDVPSHVADAAKRAYEKLVWCEKSLLENVNAQTAL